GASIFFFSSRRRHTRFSRDWSSDVCSSDLLLGGPIPQLAHDGKPLSSSPRLTYDPKDVDTGWKTGGAEPKLMLAGSERSFEDVRDLAAEHVVDRGCHQLR